ncbi:hypothetical protein ACUODJ_15140, partial [Escherichia sp. HC-CC]
GEQQFDRHTIGKGSGHHLVGKLFMDYLSPLKQQRIRQKVEKLDRLKARA